MGLSIDASSPAAVTGNPSATTASFTPPAGSMLLVMFSGNTGTAVDPPQPSITDNLGAHLTYTRHEWGNHVDTGQEGQCAIWTADVATSAAMTVTVTNNDNTDRHTAVKVYVLYGQEITDYIGAHGVGSSASANAIAMSYTAQADNGWGFIVSCDWSAVGTETAGSGCTVDASGTYTGSLFSYAFGRRTNPDDAIGGLSGLNLSLPGTSTDLTWAYIEILEFVGDPAEKDPPPFINFQAPGGLAPNGLLTPWFGTENEGPPDTGLRIHESSPDMAVQTVGTVSALTTLSFTPPAGSLLLVLWAGNTGTASGPAQPTISDSLGGGALTYTLTDWQSRADAPTVDGQAAAWTAPVVSSAPMTVTVNNLAVSGSRQAALQVIVLINEGASPVGAHGKAGSASASIITQSYTAQGTGGQGFLAVCDWSNTGAARPGMGAYYAETLSAISIPTQVSLGFFKRSIPDDVNTVANRLNVDLPGTSTNLAWVYVEILPVAGAQIEAATGDGSVGGSSYGTAVKMAPTAGVCTAGAFAHATVAQGAIVRAQTGTCTTGAAALATAVKRATGSGTSPAGAAATSTAIKRATPAGSTPLGASATSTPRKAAVATGRSSAGCAAAGTEVKRATPTGSTPVGAAATGAARKAAITVGRSTAGTAATGAARRVVGSTGTSSLGATATGAARHVAPRTGPAQAGLTATATARHVAPRAASGAAGTSATGAAAKKTAAIGSAFAGATSTHSGVSTRAVVGRCVAGVMASGAAGHVAVRTANTAVGAIARGAAAHVSARTGTSCAGSTARAAAAKKALPAGQSQTGATCTGGARKKALPNGRSLTGATGAGDVRKRAPATGVSCTGAIPTIVATARAVTGRSFAGVFVRHRQPYTYRPVTGTTVRPDTGDTLRPGSGTTARPSSGVTLRPVTTLTERP